MTILPWQVAGSRLGFGKTLGAGLEAGRPGERWSLREISNVELAWAVEWTESETCLAARDF